MERVERGTDVALLAMATVMLSGARTGAAKIESQHGDAEGIERLRRLIDDFVVHGAAEKRVRVADDGGERGTRGGGGRPKNCFEASSRTFEKEIARIMSCGHWRTLNEGGV